MPFKRRSVFSFCAATLVASAGSKLAFAQQAESDGNNSQSEIPQPYRIVNIPQFKNTVIEIFEFGCPYCRALNNQLVQWGETLPRGWTFVQIPALVSQQYYVMSLAYLAEKEADPNGLQAFMTHCFSLIQDQGYNIADVKTYMKAASLTGTNLSDFYNAFINTKNKSTLAEIVRLNSQAAIVDTPSLIINGEFLVTPNDTNGNYGLFISLANGLVSQVIQSTSQNQNNSN